jgi:hypothetical protein
MLLCIIGGMNNAISPDICHTSVTYVGCKLYSFPVSGTYVSILLLLRNRPQVGLKHCLFTIMACDILSAESGCTFSEITVSPVLNHNICLPTETSYICSPLARKLAGPNNICHCLCLILIHQQLPGMMGSTMMDVASDHMVFNMFSICE